MLGGMVEGSCKGKRDEARYAKCGIHACMLVLRLSTSGVPHAFVMPLVQACFKGRIAL